MSELHIDRLTDEMTISEIDEDGEVELTVINNFTDSSIYIGIDRGIQIINHLKKQFNIE